MGAVREVRIPLRGMETAPSAQMGPALEEAQGLILRPGVVTPHHSVSATTLPAAVLRCSRDGVYRLTSTAVWYDTTPYTMPSLRTGAVPAALDAQQFFSMGIEVFCLSNNGQTPSVLRLESTLTADGAQYAETPAGLGHRIANLSLSSGTALADGYARAYRVTWHRIGPSGREYGGPPLARWVVANRSYTPGYAAATTANASMRIPIPTYAGRNAILGVGWFARVWGTRSYQEASSGGDDEMYLLKEYPLTAADVTAGYFSFTDSTPDAYLIGAPALHTNVRDVPFADAGLLSGVANANEGPPVCADACTHLERAWYVVSYEARRIQAELLSIGGTGGLADGDTVTVGVNGTNLTFTARTAPTLSTEFQIYSGGPSTDVDVRRTVESMAAVINAYAVANNHPHRMWTVGLGRTAPGMVVVAADFAGSLDVTLNVSRTTAFAAHGGYVWGNAVTAPYLGNVLAYSRTLRPDMVPPSQRLRVTAGTILRIASWGDTLWCWCSDGLYAVRGRTPQDFAVEYVGPWRYMGGRVLAVGSLGVYALCYEGLVRVGHDGVRVVSDAIAPSLGSWISDAGVSVVATVWVMHYDASRRLVVLALDTGRMYAFCEDTGAWVTYTMGVDGAVVRCLASDETGLVAFGVKSSVEYRLAIDTATWTTSFVTWRAMAPEAAGATHWQSVVARFDGTPTSISLTATPDGASGETASVASGELGPSVRMEVPQSSRRAPGCRLKVSWTGGVSLFGVSVQYRPEGRWPRGAS